MMQKPEGTRVGCGALYGKNSYARELAPYTALRWEREGLKEWFDSLPSEEALDGMILSQPWLRQLKDDGMREILRGRAPWPARKKYYKAFQRLTGDRRPWSLQHPFDDRSEEQMRSSIEAAHVARKMGLRGLTAEQRRLLLLIEQFTFFEKLWQDAQARR